MSGILFIDAEQPFADQMVGALKGRGYSVKLLDDGKDGLDYAKDNRPDVIVLCVELPKMSGYSICNKLKKDNDLKGIPLLITSKEATPETFAQHKKLKTRAEDYLIKPFAEAELFEKIAAYAPAPAGGGKSAGKPSSSGNGAKAAATDDAFDALDALGSDEGKGGASDLDLDASFSSLGLGDDPVPASKSTDDDDLLAGLDSLGEEPKTKTAMSGKATKNALEDMGLGSLEDEINGDDPLAGLGDVDEPTMAPAPPVAKAKPAPEPVKPSTPAPPRTSSSMPPTAADLAAAQQLRRDNTDLKTKIAELEARLKAAEDTAKQKEQQLAAASSGAGASSAREVLTLKDQLRNKDKEIAALKDEMFEKEKASVDAQEALERAQAEWEQKLEGTKSKDIEISGLKAKLASITEERDDLERQVQDRLAAAEHDRDEAQKELDGVKAELSKTKGDLEKSKSMEDRYKVDLDRAKFELSEEKKGRTTAEAKLKEAESEAKTQEDRATKAYQRLRSEENAREKAKKALEQALAALADDGGRSKPSDLELDAE